MVLGSGFIGVDGEIHGLKGVRDRRGWDPDQGQTNEHEINKNNLKLN